MLQLQEILDTCNSDFTYEKTLHATKAILFCEDRRQLHLQQLLVDAERNELRRKLDLNDTTIDAMGKQHLRTQQELKTALRNFDKVDSDLRACRCENEALKVCDSFSGYPRDVFTLM